MGYKKSQVSIAQIIEATIRVLARQGYANTSLMDIANEVGMSKGAVHYHFPTKEALMTHVLQTACDAVAERTRKAWTTGGNPLDALRSTLRELWRVRAQLSPEAKVVADLLAQALHDPNLRAPLAEYYRFAAAQVDEHLANNLSDLGIRLKVEPRKVSRILHALLDGLFMQSIVDPEAFTEDEVVEMIEMLASAFFEFAPPPQ
jgi:AcrR family transcriptional regulator